MMEPFRNSAASLGQRWNLSATYGRFCLEQLEDTLVNKFCAQITTSEEDSRLLRLILAEDNEMGPMGSGGYRIRPLDRVEGAIHVQFNQMDCSPSPTNYVFIKHGIIWVTYMKGWMMRLLADNNISFSSEQVENPAFIEQKMLELQAA